VGFVTALNILVAVSSNSSYALIVGSLLAGYWLHAVTGPRVKQVTASLAGPVMRRVGIMSLTVLIVCHLVRPWFVASSMSGSTEFRASLALVPTILSSTRQGGLWYTNSVALVVLFAAQSFIKARAPSIATWVEMTALCVLAATKAASTHASEEGDLSPAQISEFFSPSSHLRMGWSDYCFGSAGRPSFDCARRGPGSVELWKPPVENRGLGFGGVDSLRNVYGLA